MARPIEQVAPVLVLGVGPIFDFEPSDARVIGVDEPAPIDRFNSLPSAVKYLTPSPNWAGNGNTNVPLGVSSCSEVLLFYRKDRFRRKLAVAPRSGEAPLTIRFGDFRHCAVQASG
jgi:hypothetical protein